MLRLDDVEQRQAVEPAAFEPDVEQDELRPARGHRRQRLVRVLGHAGGIAFVGQDARDQVADIRLVIDDEDVGGHFKPYPLLRLPPERRAVVRPSIANRNRTQAPRPPCAAAGAS